VDKRVAPDREGATDKQCQGEGKLWLQYMITNHEDGKGKPPPSAISQDRISIRISRTCSTAEDWRERVVVVVVVVVVHNHFTALLDSVSDYPGELIPERKNQSGFTGAWDSEWQWHQLGHMQICTLTQTHNHASIPPLSFYRQDAFPAARQSASKHWRQKGSMYKVMVIYL